MSGCRWVLGPFYDVRVPPRAGRAGLKTVLAVLTLALMGSFGAQILLPALIPLHLLAARTAGPVGRLLWSLPAGAAAATWAWIVVYVQAGEAEPAIWLVPLLAATAATFAMWRAARPAVTEWGASG